MHKLKPKKHLGQHFLTDNQIAVDITELLGAGKSDSVAEIGPGQGVLTVHLWKRFPNLLLVEVDPEAVEFLNQNYKHYSPRIKHIDVLKWKLAEDLPLDSYLIGNLPYNISSPIFFHILEHLPYVKEGVFMIQKEVADRICAKPGNKTYGILSVLLGAYFDLEYGFTVPAHVFRPPPKVTSAVIRMRRKELVPDIALNQLKRVVKTAFNQRRKTLRNALKSLRFKDFPEMNSWLTLRAENLSVEEFIKLTQHLETS